MDVVLHSDSREVVGCQPMECQKNYKRVTVEDLSTSSVNEHMQETKGTSVEIPGVNIPESVESITSVQVLAVRTKQSSLGG